MVRHFNGGKFPLWLMRMTVVRENDERILLHNVVRIELIDCKRCQQLPTLGHLPFLRVLRIKGLESIKCIGTEFYTHNDCDDRVTSRSNSNHGSSSKALVLFPALRTLEICNFPNLTEWLEPPYPMGMTCTLPFLETLKIRDCPLLTTTPRNFSSLGHLEIQGIISSQPLHNIVIGSQEVILALYLLSLAFHCVPPSLHNQTLKTLSVSKVQELTYLPLFQHTSLEKLEIRDCGKLMCLPNGLENLVSLKTLEVRGCQLLITFPDISCLNSLRELTIANCHGLTWTPIGLESYTALEILKICECDNIDNVPDLKKLSRLEDVSIYDCGDQLTSLLKVGLQSMPRLSYLVIGGCKSKLDEEPEDFPDISPLLGIKSLRALGLVCWPKLKFLPEQLQHFTALGELGINSFDGSEVPEWIGGLLSLNALGFKECWNLKYLPSRSALLRLEKLRCLQIEDCPLLKERCAKENGPEWHKICHIELIEIDGQPI